MCQRIEIERIECGISFAKLGSTMKKGQVEIGKGAGILGILMALQMACSPPDQTPYNLEPRGIGKIFQIEKEESQQKSKSALKRGDTHKTAMKTQSVENYPGYLESDLTPPRVNVPRQPTAETFGSAAGRTYASRSEDLARDQDRLPVNQLGD